MALPVKETPILKGKAAKAFSKKYLEEQPKAIPKEELKRMKANFQRFDIKMAND